MPTYLFWGEDDFSLSSAVMKLQQTVLHPDWLSFNYDKVSTEDVSLIIEALTIVRETPAMMGDRLVWLNNCSICQRCPDNLLTELKELLPIVLETNHLLITTSNKPDGRLKSTKLLQEYAIVKEFSFIPPWKTEDLVKKVEELAAEAGLKFTRQGAEFLVGCVGNNTRMLWNEIEKISLYYQNISKALDERDVAYLVNPSNQNSIQLAEAIKDGKLAKALELVTALINHNEPALKIVATLVGLFRTWGLVKLMIDQDDKTIATKADIGNPKRIYILRREVQNCSSQKLLAALPILLELEYSLKRGAEPLTTLQTKIIELVSVIDSARNGLNTSRGQY